MNSSYCLYTLSHYSRYLMRCLYSLSPVVPLLCNFLLSMSSALLLYFYGHLSNSYFVSLFTFLLGPLVIFSLRCVTMSSVSRAVLTGHGRYYRRLKRMLIFFRSPTILLLLILWHFISYSLNAFLPSSLYCPLVLLSLTMLYPKYYCWIFYMNSL